MIKKKEAKSGKKKWEKNERKKLIITDGSIALAFKQILSVRDLNNWDVKSHIRSDWWQKLDKWILLRTRGDG